MVVARTVDFKLLLKFWWLDLSDSRGFQAGKETSQHSSNICGRAQSRRVDEHTTGDIFGRLTWGSLILSLENWKMAESIGRSFDGEFGSNIYSIIVISSALIEDDPFNHSMDFG